MTPKNSLEAEEILAKGGSINVDTTQPASSVFSVLLRAYFGRNDLSTAALSLAEGNTFWISVEQIRSAISAGNLALAESLLSEAKSTNPIEDAELEIEWARLFAYQKKWRQCLDSIRTCFKSRVSPLSQMTAYQVRGCAYLGLGQTDIAIQDFRCAAVLGTEMPLAQSGFYAHAFLIKALCKLGQRVEATRELEILKLKLSDLESMHVWFDRALVYLRAESFVLNTVGAQNEELLTLELTRKLAKWGGHENILRDVEADIGTRTFDGSLMIYCFPAWTYVPSLCLVLCDLPKKFTLLRNTAVLRRMIEVLIEGPKSHSEFFTLVWGHKYKPHVHAMHVRSNISKLRRLLPANSIENQDGCIRLLGQATKPQVT